jgi:excisionase family DNA binding protein
MCDNCRMVTHASRPYRRAKKELISQELLDLDQVAVFLGTSRRFVEMEVARGRLKKTMLSSRLARISRDELKRYAAALTLDAAGEGAQRPGFVSAKKQLNEEPKRPDLQARAAKMRERRAKLRKEATSP